MIENRYSQSKITSKNKCSNFKGAGSSLASETGTILHSYFSDEEIAEVGGVKGSYYRGVFSPFLFKHDFEALKEEADMFRERNPEWFNQWTDKKWSYEEQIDAEFNLFNCKTELTGILDRLSIQGDRAIIADFKTGTVEVDVTNLDSIFQAILYSFLVFKKYPFVKEISFYWIYTRKGGKIKEVSFSRKDREFIKTNIYFNIMLTEKVGLKESVICSYCANISNCPIMNQNLLLLEKGELKADYNTYLKLENSIKAKKEELKDSVRQEKRYFSDVTKHHVDAKSLTHEQFMKLQDKIGKISINKKELQEFKDLGLKIEETKSLRFKPPRS